MGSPWGLQQQPARRGGRKSAQSRPLAKTGFSLDGRPDFGKLAIVEVTRFPGSGRYAARPLWRVLLFWGLVSPDSCDVSGRESAR